LLDFWASLLLEDVLLDLEDFSFEVVVVVVDSNMGSPVTFSL